MSSTSSSSAASDTSSTSDKMPSTGIVTTGNRVLHPDEVLKPGPHPLVDHPDETISAIARDYSELESELISTGPQYIRWPANITYKNFWEYLLIPTLVYELEYPRTDRCVSTFRDLRAETDLAYLTASVPCTSLRRRSRRSERSHCCTR